MDKNYFFLFDKTQIIYYYKSWYDYIVHGCSMTDIP